MLLAHGEHGVGEPAAPAQEWLRAEGPVDGELQAVLFQHRLDALLQRAVAAFGREAEIEIDLHRPGDHVRRAGAGMDIGHLEARWREALVALVPLGARELGEGGGNEMHGVSHQVRIGDMPLEAAHDELRGKRAAPSVLQHVPERVDRRWLAHDAVVDALVSLL